MRCFHQQSKLIADILFHSSVNAHSSILYLLVSQKPCFFVFVFFYLQDAEFAVYSNRLFWQWCGEIVCVCVCLRPLRGLVATKMKTAKKNSTPSSLMVSTSCGLNLLTALNVKHTTHKHTTIAPGFPSRTGAITGVCLPPADPTNETKGQCEIEGWCPAEQENHEM